MAVAVIVEIPTQAVAAVIQDEIRRNIAPGLNQITDEVLDLIAQAQILSYTATAGPPKPAGSTYERTFRLQSASRSKRTGDHLPDISGEWYADESVAEYAKYVLGSEAEQAAIHRGRWKSEEDVAAQVQRKIPGLVRKHFGG